MAQYELTYKHPSFCWSHDGGAGDPDYWSELQSTHVFDATDEKTALRDMCTFLNSHADWGDYKSDRDPLPEDIKLVNMPVKLTKIIQVWK